MYKCVRGGGCHKTAMLEKHVVCERCVNQTPPDDGRETMYYSTMNFDNGTTRPEPPAPNDSPSFSSGGGGDFGGGGASASYDSSDSSGSSSSD